MTPQLDPKFRFKIKESLRLILGEGKTPIATRPDPFSFCFPRNSEKDLRKVRIIALGYSFRRRRETWTQHRSRRPSSQTPNCLMKGILIVINPHNSNANSFNINEWFKLDAKIYGLNGLNGGALWLYRICTPRDGVHGHSVVGIFGSKSGAYSIVLSGKYSSLDKDLGESVTYSDSRALHNKKTRSADCSGTILAMNRSFKRLERHTGIQEFSQ